MTLPFPWPVYGEVYDSNGDLVGSGYTVTATGDSAATDTTDTNGVYVINMQDYASSGGNVTVTADVLGESFSASFTVSLRDAGKEQDVNLVEADEANDIYLNTHRNYGDDVYIFSPDEDHLGTWMKTSSY